MIHFEPAKIQQVARLLPIFIEFAERRFMATGTTRERQGGAVPRKTSPGHDSNIIDTIGSAVLL